MTTLEQAIRQGKVAHAYLFAGSRGTGKTSVARILAKALLTRGIKDEVIRNQIEQGVTDGSLVDLLEIDAASNRGIDDVRDLIEKIQFSPVASGAKVYVIDEAHMLTKEAFNALLKTLEEPPEYAFFILCTTELHKVPATIQSRCQCFPFHRIRTEDIVRRLQYIADSEKIVIDREALRAVAEHAQGGLRDAISLMDQLRSLPKITLPDVSSRTGLSGQEAIAPTIQAIASDDRGALIEIVAKLENAGIPLDTFLRQLLEAVRRNLHEAVNAGTATDMFEQQLDTLLTALRDLRAAPVPGLVAEAALLSLCTRTSTSTTVEEPKKRKVKGKVESSLTVTKTESEPPVAASSPATFEAKEVTLQNIKEEWPTVLSRTTPPSVRMSLKDARITAVDDTTVTLTFASAFHRDKVAAIDASRTVEAILTDIFKQPLKLHCEIGGPKTRISAKEEAVNLAEAAAEIF